MIPLHTRGLPVVYAGVKRPLFRGSGGVPVAPCLPLVRGLIGSYRGQMRGLWGLKQGV